METPKNPEIALEKIVQVAKNKLLSEVIKPIRHNRHAMETIMLS